MQAPNFTIDHEFQARVPALSVDEHQALEQKLLKEGCTEPFIVWSEEKKLLDGHTRLKICVKHNIAYATREISLPDREAALLWIIEHALSRRNLSEQQKALLRGTLFRAKLKTYHYGEKAAVLDALTKEHDISIGQLRNDMQYSEAAEAVIAKAGEPARAAIQAGKISKRFVQELQDKEPDDVKREVIMAVTEPGKKHRMRGRPRKHQTDTPQDGALPHGDAHEGLTPEETAVEATKLQEFDMQGTELPANLRDDFADTLFDNAIEYVKNLAKTVKDNQRAYPYLFGQPFFDQCEGLLYLLECHRPWTVCDQCNGHGSDCQHCRLSGYLSKSAWEQIKSMAYTPEQPLA